MTIRLFVGLTLPDAVRASLAELCWGVPGARWLPPQNLHLTLRFIGNIDEGLGDDIDSALKSVNHTPFRFDLKGIDVFGEKTPRALFVGTEPRGELAALAQKIDRTLVRAGLEPEGRKFVPHVTLARFKQPARAKVREYRSANSMFRAGPIEVNGFTLFESTLGREGSHYHEVSFYAFTPAKNAA